VAAYEGEKGLAVLQLPTCFDNPYKFLDAFGLEDRYRFFGRDGTQQKLRDARAVEPLVAALRDRDGSVRQGAGIGADRAIRSASDCFFGGL
jgi:hypothetical protein